MTKWENTVKVVASSLHIVNSWEKQSTAGSCHWPKMKAMWLGVKQSACVNFREPTPACRKAQRQVALLSHMSKCKRRAQEMRLPACPHGLLFTERRSVITFTTNYIKLKSQSAINSYHCFVFKIGINNKLYVAIENSYKNNLTLVCEAKL